MTDAGSPVSSETSSVSRSHLGIEPFVLAHPASLAEAAALVAEGAWLHAGGIDVTQRLRAGERATSVVPLGHLGMTRRGGLAELHEIAVRGPVLFIGAAVTHACIESDDLVERHRPDLAAAWRTIGNIRIRAVGTVGGNLMSFNPANDAAPILAAADAVLVFAEPDGGEYRCAVGGRPDNRLLIGCEVPRDGRVTYDRSHKPVVSVAVGDARVAVGCVYSAVETFPFDSGSLDNGDLDLDGPNSVRAALAALGPPLDDSNASAAYRRRVVEVLVKRTIRRHRDGASRSALPRQSASAGTDAAEPVAAVADATAAAGRHPNAVAATSVEIRLRLNGSELTAEVPPAEMLVDTIRARAGLGGTRVGCDQAVCGACTVLVEGQPTASCSTFSWQVDGHDVLTIEAAAAPTAAIATDRSAGRDGDLVSLIPVVQQAFADTSAFQCGYCTPGLILTASALLARHRDPDRPTICDWLDSNICRCTGYLMVIEAVEAAAAARNDSPPPDGTAS